MPYDPVFAAGHSISRLAVMEGRTLAIGAFRTRLDENFNIIATDAKEREKIRAGMEEVEARNHRRHGSVPARHASATTDEIVRLPEIRSYLGAILEMSYQSTGYRRVKTPASGSLHDLSALDLRR